MPLTAVVLAAGEGTRLLPFTSTEPKVLLPVGNEPILEHVFRALKQASIRDVLLVVGYKHERVRNAVGDGRRLGLRVNYVFQEKQLGTAHALTVARKHLKGRFLVLNGDNLVEGPALREFISGSKEGTSILAVRRATKRRTLVVERGRVLRIRPLGQRPEKEELANTGIFLLTQEIFKVIEGLEPSERGEYEIVDALQALIDRGVEVAAHTTRHGWDEIVTPLDLLRANSAILDRRGGAPPRPRAGVEPGAWVQGAVSIGPGTKIRAGSYIVGPVSIGSNCDIGPYAVILPSTSVGNGTRVGPFCYVRNSILMSDVRAEPYSHISNSIIGHHARVGAGVHLESRPADGHAPEAELGALVGEGASVGDHALVHAGIVLGVRCTVGSGATVRKNVPDGATIL